MACVRTIPPEVPRVQRVNVRPAGLASAVVGFDDVDGMGAPPFEQPFLTTIRDPNFEMGVKAAELLLDQIEKGSAPRRVVLPTELVIRRSG